MRKRIVLLLAASAMVALFAQIASAQFGIPGIDLTPDGSRHLTPEEKEKFKEIDQQYTSTMKKVPDKKQPQDPWAGVRQEAPTKQGQR